MPIPKRLESSIEASVVRWARSNGIKAIKIQGMGNKSLPDRLFLLPGGKVFWIEFKRPGSKPTPLQEIAINDLRNLGFRVEIYDDRDAAVAALSEALYSPPIPTKSN